MFNIGDKVKIVARYSPDFATIFKYIPKDSFDWLTGDSYIVVYDKPNSILSYKSVPNYYYAHYGFKSPANSDWYYANQLQRINTAKGNPIIPRKE